MHSSQIPLQHIFEMRDFMNACKEYNQLIFEDMVSLTSPAPIVEDMEVIAESRLVGKMSHPIMDDLKNAVQSLRAYMESAGGEYGQGFEDGMDRAAGMIEMLIERHEGK